MAAHAFAMGLRRRFYLLVLLLPLLFLLSIDSLLLRDAWHRAKSWISPGKEHKVRAPRRSFLVPSSFSYQDCLRSRRTLSRSGASQKQAILRTLHSGPLRC